MAPCRNLSNAASLLWHAYASLPQPSASVNWAGFYVRADKFYAPCAESASASAKADGAARAQPETLRRTLLLGPFQGKPACQSIAFGRGVCGTAADQRRSTLVEDVHSFPGHIACDGDSQSEIVVPIIVEGEVVAIIDVDCAVKSGFDAVDVQGLEALAAALAEGCDW
ncbi:hypothetical protein KEM52_002922 [Ascosphaera acerosa]|nr:hypothetical protein KEM52_002922 [Ascosphaera acerosa]